MAMDLHSYQMNGYKSSPRSSSRESYVCYPARHSSSRETYVRYPVTVGRNDDPSGPTIFPMVHYDTTFSTSDVTHNKGSAVAKLLEDDLDWTAKYLHSENLARTSGVVVPTSGGATLRGRETEVRREENGGRRQGRDETWENGGRKQGIAAVITRPRSLSRVGLRSTERVSVPRPITSHVPQPRYARSSSVVYRPSSYKTNSNFTSSSSSSASPADDYHSMYQPVPSSAFLVTERRYSKDFSNGLQAPRKSDLFVSDYSSNHQQLNGRPEMSDTRRRLRKLICETRKDPYMFD